MTFYKRNNSRKKHSNACSHSTVYYITTRGTSSKYNVEKNHSNEYDTGIMIDRDYLDTIKERAQKSRVYTEFQMMGLLIAQALGDSKHKALYIKLAKNLNNRKLLEIARRIEENKRIANRGAYFMRIMQKEGFLETIKHEAAKLKKKTQPIRKKTQ